MTIPNTRQLNLAGFLICVGMMAFALFSQYVMLLVPCPLCILQRIATILLGLVFLSAALQNPGQTGARIYGVLVGLVAAGGTAIAAWHVHLQNMPADEVPSCGPGYDYIMNNFAIMDAMSMIFEGSGECAEGGPGFLGLSMPGWVVVALLGLGVIGVWNNFRK